MEIYNSIHFIVVMMMTKSKLEYAEFFDLIRNKNYEKQKTFSGVYKISKESSIHPTC